jgi:hypothetical protein
MLLMPSVESTHPLKRRLAGAATNVAILERPGPTDRPLPFWIRAPVKGPEYYTGFSRSKLYELAQHGKILSVSIREAGQQSGTRLFELKSILTFIESRVAAQKAAQGNGNAA